MPVISVLWVACDIVILACCPFGLLSSDALGLLNLTTRNDL